MHPDQDESYLGLNSIDQAVLVSDSKDVEIYLFNESFSPVTIDSNCVIGSISVPEHHPSVIDMTSVLTIAPDSSSESLWIMSPQLNYLVRLMPTDVHMFIKFWTSLTIQLC